MALRGERDGETVRERSDARVACVRIAQFILEMDAFRKAYIEAHKAK